MIAWKRSRAASGYGILWGGTQIETNKKECSTECHSVDCSDDSKVLTELPDSNKIEDIVLEDQKSRKLKRIRTTGLAAYLYDCTIL